MALDPINLGTGVGTGDGDPLRTALGKANANDSYVEGLAKSAAQTAAGKLNAASNLSDLGDKAAARANLGGAAAGHTAINDVNYQVIAADADVAFTALTAPRVVKLCDVDTYPLGQDLVIGDESGSCSPTVTITILVGDGTSDTIPQQSDGAIVLAYAFASVRLRRGAANIWKIV